MSVPVSPVRASEAARCDAEPSPAVRARRVGAAGPSAACPVPVRASVAVVGSASGTPVRWDAEPSLALRARWGAGAA